MPARRPATAAMPDPSASTDVAEFVGLLNRLRIWAGQPSLRRLRVLGGRTRTLDGSMVDVLPPSTTSAILNGEGLPRLPRMEFVEALVAACLRHRDQPASEIDQQVDRWREVWRRLAISQQHDSVDDRKEPDPEASPTGRSDLPGDVTDFTGRADELRLLLSIPPQGDEPAAAMVVVAIDGMAGVGKTTLAVHAAHQLADHYPDGQLFIDLHAHAAGRDPLLPGDVLDTLLRAWGVGVDQIPDRLEARAALWRAQLAHRRVLIVLDDADNADQVRHLLPGSAGCLTLVTSRRRLADLVARHTLSLDVLSSRDAITLFTQALGDDRGGREPVAVGDVVRLCGYLPLAIRLAAARLRTRPAWAVTHLVDRMRNGRRRLRELAVGDRSVAAAFGLSYQHLPAVRQRMFRLLGLLPGRDFDASLVAALTDCEFEEAEQALEELLDVHLLLQPAAGRYRLHDLLHQHAHRLAHETGTRAERRAALTRTFDYYLRTATKATGIITSGWGQVRSERAEAATLPPEPSNYAQAISWLDRERPNLLAATASPHLPGHASRLSIVLWRYFHFRGNGGDALAMYTNAVNAARAAGDRVLEARVLGGLGLVHACLGRYEDALEHLEQSLAVAGEVGDRALQARVLSGLGLVHACFGRYESALEHLERSLAVAGETGKRALEGRVLGGLGLVHACFGRYEGALEHLKRSLAVASETGDRVLEARVLGQFGYAYGRLGRYEDALEHLERCLALVRDMGDRHLECEALDYLGEATRSAGKLDRALGYHEQALALAGKVGNRYEQARAHDGLACAHHRLGDCRRAVHHWQLAMDVYNELGRPEGDQVRRELEALSGCRPRTIENVGKTTVCRPLEGVGFSLLN